MYARFLHQIMGSRLFPQQRSVVLFPLHRGALIVPQHKAVLVLYRVAQEIHPNPAVSAKREQISDRRRREGHY